MDIAEVARIIIGKRSELPSERSVLVGISGVDASGKGSITRLLEAELTSRGFRTAVMNVDGWLNLPHIRFEPNDLPGNFYRNAIRSDQMFEQLVLPLKEHRSIRIIADFTEETAAEYRLHRFDFRDIDVILLEGIFLFKREFLHHYDLKIWIDCSFETALARAIARGQEDLTAEATVTAYERIYFPAQKLHFELDAPFAAADVVFNNDL